MLQQCVDDLRSLRAIEVDTKVQTKLSSLLDDIARLSSVPPSSSNQGRAHRSEAPFAQAVRHLNDPLMPTRAHALVSLKQLFYAKDEQTLEHCDEVVERLKVCMRENFALAVAVATDNDDLSEFLLLYAISILP